MVILNMMAKVVIETTQQACKVVCDHVVKNAGKYVVGAGAAIMAAGGKFIYNFGKKKGHTEGKKEGTAEQAQRDEVKFNDQHNQHESDRRKWNEQKQAYEDFIDEIK